jgi:hypothetical protein
MFWAFKLIFDAENVTLLSSAVVATFFQKLGTHFLNHLVTLIDSNTETGLLLNKSSCLSRALSVTKITIARYMNLATLLYYLSLT